MQTEDITRLDYLREQIRTVRATIVDIVVRMDDITLQQIPQIRADYALKIGCWEQALLDAELAARRAKRRLALAQAQANRGEKPQFEAIEHQLDEELSAWMTKAEQARLAYEQALAFLTGTRPMTAKDSAELKRLYHMLAKRLHPDVCHAGDDQRAGLFAIAQTAYRNGNVEMLRSLEVATRSFDPADDDLANVTSEQVLAQELELARIEEDVMRERLAELEDGEEMKLGRLLADPEWVTARSLELRQAVEEWEHVRTECDERLRAMRRDIDEQ